MTLDYPQIVSDVIYSSSSGIFDWARVSYAPPCLMGVVTYVCADVSSVICVVHWLCPIYREYIKN